MIVAAVAIIIISVIFRRRVLHVPNDVVRPTDAERAGQPDADGIQRGSKRDMEEPVSTGRLRLLIIYTVVLGLVGAIGGFLIDWPEPLMTGFPFLPAVWINLTAFLFPLGYILITQITKGGISQEFTSLLLGLFYGSVLWVQTILEVFLRSNLDEKQKLGYLQGHFFDLFAVAAIVGAVSYFSLHPKRLVRIIWLMLVFAITGATTGFTEAEYMWENNGFGHYPYLVVPLLWALTGVWYGVCVGYVAPDLKVARALDNRQLSQRTGRHGDVYPRRGHAGRPAVPGTARRDTRRPTRQPSGGRRS